MRSPVPPALRAEIERESAPLVLVKQQVKALEAARCQELADGKQPQQVPWRLFERRPGAPVLETSPRGT
ncbi:hypothetical protein LP414_23715 [Polaromonas sp. P1(28)-13]|nr:hypothetical protein LP417_06135 [Polaromonas sp. P1-6]UUZ75040.1 hypothetical protein LP414_23715 [Polaromonas sp. P1(28)-13]